MGLFEKLSTMIFPIDDKAKVSSNDTSTGFLGSKLIAGTNITITENNDGGNETLTISATPGGGGGADELVKVSANDTNNQYLGQKLQAGSNVTITTQNPGANEKLQVTAANDHVRVSSNDTTPSHLQNKVLAGSNITITTNNPGANESITVAAANNRVAVTTNDTTPAALATKLIAGFGITLTVGSPGGNESYAVTLNIPSGTAAPTGGNPGDLYLQYAP